MRARCFTRTANAASKRVERARSLLTAAAASVIFLAPASWAQEDAKSDGAPAASAPAEKATGKGDNKKISIDHLRKQYWNQGGELEVVQNRVYTKAQKLEVSVGGAFMSVDPFLSVKSANLGVGYYFSEMVGARVMAWRTFSKPSSAQDQLGKIAPNAIAGTNPPKAFFGAEANINAIYGKLALFGSKIMYYDLMFAAGAGQMRTESGNYLAPMGGITQNVYINSWLGLRVDYRLVAFSEVVNVPAQNLVAAYSVKRTNFTNSIFIGANFLF